MIQCFTMLKYLYTPDKYYTVN